MFRLSFWFKGTEKKEQLIFYIDIFLKYIIVWLEVIENIMIFHNLYNVCLPAAI